jgi:hypothetical protein
MTIMRPEVYKQIYDLSGGKWGVDENALPGSPSIPAEEEWESKSFEDMTEEEKEASAARFRARMNNGASAPPPPQLTTKLMKDLLAQQFAPIMWAIPGILPEGCIILAARPKMGKSMMALGWCIAIATGGKAMDKVDVERGDVLYLSLEDGERRLQARTQAMEVYAHNCPDTFEYQDEWPTLDNGGLDLIEQWIIAHPKRRLIVIDTLIRVRSKMTRGQQLYDHDYDSVKALKELADRYHVTILVIYHTRKAPSDDFTDTLNATTGLSGSVDAILVIKRERGRADAELHMTGKDVEEIARPLRFNYPHWELLDGTAEQYRMSQERADVIEQLLVNFPSSSSPKEVATALGKNVGTVNKTMLAMLRDSQIRKSGVRGKYLPLQDYEVDPTPPTVPTAVPEPMQEHFEDKPDSSTLPIFELTSEWQDVPDGVVVPGGPGLEVRMSPWNGTKQARNTSKPSAAALIAARRAREALNNGHADQ